jgi:heptosyltransferase II
MAIPAARALYEQGFEIHWACGRAVQPLLECYSWINLIPVDEGAMLRGRPLDRARSIAGLWRRIAFRRYDLCATLYYDRRYQLLTWPIRAQRKLALSRNVRATALLPDRNRIDECVRVLLNQEDGFREQNTSPLPPEHLPLSPLPDRTALRRIAIVPGGTSNLLRQQVVRRWPIENYVTLAQSLLNRGWEVVTIGGPEDTWIRPHFQHLATTDCVGTLSLPQVISACNACDAVVSHDTGPLHLAGLSDTCLVGIFGPTNPATFLPRRSFVTGIWGGQGFACRPCYDGRDFAPCKFNGCMHQVSPELVLRELDRLLEDRSQGRSSTWRIVHPG